MRNTKIDPNEDIDTSLDTPDQLEGVEEIDLNELDEAFDSEVDEIVSSIDNSYSMSEMTDSGKKKLEEDFVEIDGIPVF